MAYCKTAKPPLLYLHNKITNNAIRIVSYKLLKSWCRSFLETVVYTVSLKKFRLNVWYELRVHINGSFNNISGDLDAETVFLTSQLDKQIGTFASSCVHVCC